ncbi:MAG TPA: phosphoglucosamine mutase [Acidimicrobiales bacterium]|nr:phosphoglucosamine mutase [Acidimicrobiales bacterium]
MSLRFGTDGVRGVAGSELTPELVIALGRAAARTLSPAERPVFLIGRDTRLSGPLIQAALSAGLSAEGVDVVDLGVMPTPGVAAVAASRGLPAAVVSASHNPFQDNGVKLLSAGGRKLTDPEEERIEALLAELTPAGVATAGDRAAGATIGRLVSDPAARDWYCDRVVAALEGRSLGGIPVIVDCANGAATTTAERILTAAGASVVEVLAASPDGLNINAGCGSTDPSVLAAAVRSKGAAAGLALDGDADRVIAVDDDGSVVDGDRLLALFARDLKGRGRLTGDTIVVTVMSNLGLRRAMAAEGIYVNETTVGDRYVLESLDANGWSLGGEQSGHIIFRDLATTGDGVLSGLMLLDLVARSGRTLSDLARDSMVRLPQVIRNVTVVAGSAADVAASGPVSSAVDRERRELGSEGRVLLRPSGTEPLVRVMVEAATDEAAAAVADRLEQAVAAASRGGLET